VLYRSAEPVAGTTSEAAGWQAGAGPDPSADVLAHAEELIPAQVQLEMKRISELRPMPTDMTRWLKLRSGAETGTG
jgi:hypothetical protein